MQKFILAAIVTYLLLPQEFALQTLPGSGETTEVSTSDAIDAAQNVLDDLGAFCERNADACQTGGALVSGARQRVLERMNANVESLSPGTNN